MSIQAADLEHFSSMNSSRSASASPNSFTSHRSSASVFASTTGIPASAIHRPILSSDHHLTSSSRDNGFWRHQHQDPFDDLSKLTETSAHTRTMSNGSSNSYSSLGTHLTTPNDSPSLDFGAGGNVLKSMPTPSRHTAIRRARHESSNPYPLRSSSFSGSESGVRASSSETEDNIGLYPFAHTHTPHAAAPSEYSSLFTRQGTAAPSSLEASPAVNAFQRMTIAPEHQDLEQLAGNVRSATTTSASDRAKHIFVQAW